MPVESGYFQVTFPGPGENMEQLRIPQKDLQVTAAAEAKLNERQRKMAELLVQGESLTSRRCEKDFGVTRDTANRDFRVLVDLGLAKRKGRGRATHYVIPSQPKLSDNRQG